MEGGGGGESVLSSCWGGASVGMYVCLLWVLSSGVLFCEDYGGEGVRW